MKVLTYLTTGLFVFLMACASTQTQTQAPAATSTPNVAVAVAQDVAPTAAPTATTAPTNTPLPTNTTAPTNTPVPTNTPTNTATATTIPTDTPTLPPTLTPTDVPTNTPANTATPTRVPTKAPTKTPVLTGLAAIVNRSNNTSSRFETIVYYSNPFTGFELFRGVGERGPQGAHFSVTGKYCGCNTSPTGAIEYLRVGDQMYLKGPVGLYKANEDRWYLIPPEKAGSAKSTEGKSLLSPGLTEFKTIGDENMDGTNYHVYTIDKEVARQRMRDILGYTEAELGQVVNIEVTFWVGDDGLVHHTRSRMDVKSFFNPNSTDIIKFDTRYFDFGIPTQFTKPTDAIPLPK